MPVPNKDTDMGLLSKLFIKSGGLDEIITKPSFLLHLFRPEFVINPKRHWWNPWVKKWIKNPTPDLFFEKYKNNGGIKFDIVRGRNEKT